ncbi:hypothetical protein LCGC14_0459070 [marine sediment metagenome]|uniref:Uncharacterized protein n=1 Tax=marine sediment metagenome TaxID=412755 RepID=A0A0F9VPC1_9ZZZZ
MAFYTIHHKGNLFDFFNETIKKLPNCEEKTRSYIISIFSDATAKDDLSKESVTLLYNKALKNYSFNNFRQIGDWLFLSKCLFPESLKNASSDYYNAIAQNSYYKCYTIMNKEWLIFEELADQFGSFTINVKKSLYSSLVTHV